MSRTDKDVPIWVSAVWYEPEHNWCDAPRRQFAAHRKLRPCDLPPEPKRQHRTSAPSTYRRGQRIEDLHCGWIPLWPDRTGAPRWYVQHIYHDPQRTLVRDTLRAAAREWNHHGDTDLEPAPIQGRGGARWYYW